MAHETILAALRGLGELHQAGVLSAEEFQREKEHLLAQMRGASGASTPPPSGADALLTGGVAPPSVASAAEVGKAGDVLGGRFRLERLLGQGGMGQVWLALDLLKGQRYALKRLLPALGRDAAFRQQFVREITLTERLQHPGIIRTLDLQIEPSGLLFYTMEYIEGRTLEAAISEARSQGQVPLFKVEQVIQWLSALAESLGYAHSQGVIHRDLKPSNVLLATDGSLKLMDFGIAKALSQTHATQHTGFKGSLHYVAPEQMRGGAALTPAADLFSLGVLGYELLTGELPLGRWKTPRERIPHLPPALDTALLRALELSPTDRFPDAASFRAALTSPATSNSSAASAPRKAGERTTFPGLEGAAFVWCPPGTFRMGSDDTDNEAYTDEKPAHPVTLTRGFWMKQTPVTQGEWQAVAGFNPSYFKEAGPHAPVECVSWFEAVWFCNELSAKEGVPAAYRWTQMKGKPGESSFALEGVEWLAESTGYRLPTEAEWEYAARAGTTTPRYGDLDKIGWYGKNSGKRTHPVGQKQANPWGLHDTLGNVWEWCIDGWAGGANYPSGVRTDSWEPLSGRSGRVVRGGSWGGNGGRHRSAYRDWFGPARRYGGLGFRLSRSF